MLTIIFEDGDVISANIPITSYFVQQVEAKKTQHLSPVEVYADGDEHELICTRFANLPHGRHVTAWVGEWAKFIAVNMKSLEWVRKMALEEL